MSACPRCPRPLRAVGTQRQAEACPDRHGLFLPAAELARALDEAQAGALAAAARGSPVPGAACPACGVAMREVRFEEVPFVVDGCVRCGGFWFDDGELAKVRADALVPWRHAVPDVPPEIQRMTAGVALGLYAGGLLGG